MRRFLPRFVAVILGTGLVLALASAALAVPVSWLGEAGSGQPDPRSLELGPLPQRSYVYAADGSLIAALQNEENREAVPIDQVPKHVIDAILAVEDAGFWIHDGYDVRGMMRALVANVDSGGISQGGSTITQQLVKLELLDDKQTLDRKVQEIVLAQRLEKEMTKHEILNRYLNKVYFGNHAYGVQAAAETYFGLNAKDLDVGQAAMLAGIIRNPIVYNPVRYPERAQKRREVAIDRMVDTGALSEDEAAYWHALPTTPQFHEFLPKPNDYFPSYVKDLLLSSPEFSMLGETREARRDAVFEGGLHIATTLDPAAQQQAVAARDTQLPLQDGVVPQPGANPETGEPNRATAALVSVEPATGAVRTMVGGPGFANYQYNLATQNPRGVGSSFKTFVLASILEQGHSPVDVINGMAPCRFADDTSEGGVYEVGNFGESQGSMGTLIDATLSSSNCAFVRLGLIAGSEKVAEMAYRLGIPRERPPLEEGGEPQPVILPVKSAPLGVARITPLEMASAYATLANDGVYNKPFVIERITDRDGKVIYQHAPAPEPRIDHATARLVTSILEQNVQRGTGTRAQIAGQPAAGKTGTNQNFTDAWFVGYTPALSTAVWLGGLGHEYTVSINGSEITGGQYPARIWGAFMNAWQQSHGTAPFPGPPARPGGKPLNVPGGVDLSPPPPPPAPPAGPPAPPGPPRPPTFPPPPRGRG